MIYEATSIPPEWGAQKHKARIVETQAMAGVQAPKVTINGLVDFVTTAYKNWSQSGSQAGSTVGQPDATNSKEKGWYSRERGVFTLTGEVGRVKGVWAIELDFTNGAGNFATWAHRFWRYAPLSARRLADGRSAATTVIGCCAP